MPFYALDLTASPGLVIVADDDQDVVETIAQRYATMFGATTVAAEQVGEFAAVPSALSFGVSLSVEAVRAELAARKLKLKRLA